MMIETSVEKAFLKKYPEQVVLVTTISKTGNPNIITLGWSMQTSFDPPMLAISIGHTRYSHFLLNEIPEFVLCFPSEQQKEAVIYCGTHSGRQTDKFKETGLVQVKSRYVKPPVISESVAAFECKIVSKLKTGDHTIFTGEILVAWTSEKNLRRLYNFGGSFSSIPDIKT